MYGFLVKPGMTGWFWHEVHCFGFCQQAELLRSFCQIGVWQAYGDATIELDMAM